MKFKKLLILLCMVIFGLPNIGYAEENKEYNWQLPNLEDETKEDEKEDKNEYVYFFYDKSLIRMLCKNPGACKFFYKDGVVEKFALTNLYTIDDVRNALNRKDCDGKDCFSYIKENYCDNWNNEDKICEGLEVVETIENDGIVTGFNCGGAEVLRVLKFVFLIIDLVLFIVPMGLIVMIMIDFMKNVIAGKEDEMKKNANIAIKRIGFAAALFLIPHVISFVVWLLGSLGVDYATCINIAEKEENLWKYTIDWEYYPYGGEYGGEKPLAETDDYVIWERYTEDENGNKTVVGNVKIYKDENGKWIVSDFAGLIENDQDTSVGTSPQYEINKDRLEGVR